MEHIVGFRDGLHHGRRDFLRFAGFGIAGSLLPSVAFGGRPLPPLNVRQAVVEVGAERPFSVLHVSDSHLVRIDSRDGEDLYAFAKSRSRIGRELGEYYLGEAVHHARARKIKLIHTGDFMDFVSEANLEHAERRLCTDDFLACVGNHEYWIDAQHRQIEAYKAPTIPRLKGAWSGIPASTHLINGVNFFVFDDSFEAVTQEVFSAFEQTLKEGRPVVMVCHVPLWAEESGLKKHVCGKPGLKTDDEVSCAFVERARREPLVKAVLAGHIHMFKQFRFSPTAVEFVAGALFKGDCTEILFT